MESVDGPLNQLTSVIFAQVSENLPRDLTWPILLLTIGLATGIWLFRGGLGAKGADGRVRPMPLGEFLLPREIYFHISARVDVSLYIFERLLRPLWATAVLLSIAPSTEALVMGQLDAWFGSGPALQVHYGWMLLYSLVTLLFYDFLFFVIHFLEHKIPILWAIHKVHHSAEVLTPLTRYREHFLEGPIYAAGAAAAFGLAGGFSDGYSPTTSPRLHFSILDFLQYCSASTAHFVTTMWPFTILAGCQNGCKVLSCITPITVILKNIGTRIWQRSPAFGTGCLARYTYLIETNTLPGVWGRGCKRSIALFGRMSRAHFATGQQ